MTALDHPPTTTPDTGTVDLIVERHTGPVRADHPHLLAALREELDVTSPKDGCSPSGQCGCCTVLVDGKAVVSCHLPLARVAGKSVVTLEGVDRGRAAIATPTRSPRAAACSAGSASPASSCGPRPRSTRRAPTSTARRHGPAPRRPPLPLHRLREGARRHRGRRPGQGADPRAARRHRQPRQQVRGRRAGARRPRLHRRHPRAGHAARRAAPHRARPCRRARDRHRRRRSPRRASSPCSPPPTSPASCASASSTRTGR